MDAFSYARVLFHLRRICITLFRYSYLSRRWKYFTFNSGLLLLLFRWTETWEMFFQYTVFDSVCSRQPAVGWICLSLYFFASFTDATKTNEIELSVHVLRWKYWHRFSLFICYRLFFFWQETEKRRESREKWHWHSQCHFSSAANRWI